MYKRGFWQNFLTFTLISVASTPAAQNVNWLNQGLSDEQIQTWYGQSQGSRLIPLSWYRELVDPVTGLDFATPENYAQLEFPFLTNTSKYPLGFVEDRDGDRAWLGMTCAACHTGRLSFNGQDYFIHGGANWGRFAELIDRLSLAVAELRTNDAALDRIAGVENREKADILAEIDEWLAHRANIDRIRDNVEPWGPGRLDALGYIYQTVRSVVAETPEAVSPAANAPVNPMPVWNTVQQEVLQYNGVAPNGPNLGFFAETRLGAYLRNYGEALGVFGEVSFDRKNGIQSSINPKGLIALERAITTLESPKWPASVFGAIDFDKALAGAPLYRDHCASCHAIIASDDVTSPLKLAPFPKNRAEPFTYMQPLIDDSLTALSLSTGEGINPELIGTDPMMACNFVTQQAPSGKLAGERRTNSISFDAYIERYREIEPTSELFAGLIFRDFLAKSDELSAIYISGEVDGVVNILKSWYREKFSTGGVQTFSKTSALTPLAAATLACAEYARELHNDPSVGAEYPAYKARPLNGVFSTAPYLHNGSVPSLDDLLKPTGERPTKFKFNGVEFDPVRVGLVYHKDGEDFDFRVYGDDGQVILGNWNGGHEYGTGLDAEARAALVEYLKLL